MTHIAVISNDKGGVSKSQVTVQLAAALARATKRVLVIDFDPQANATRRLGIEWNPEEPFATMSEVIKADQVGVGEGAVLACGWTDADGSPTGEAEYIDVLPSRFDLVNRETEAGVVGAVRRLKKALEGWTDVYDAILIDTPPSLGHLTQMAMAAADTVIIPATAQYDSVEAAIRVSDFVARHAGDLANPELTVGAVIVTRYKDQLEHEFQVQGLRDTFGDLVWDLTGVVELPNGNEVIIPRYIREWARYADADSAAVSLSAWRDREGRRTVAAFDALARLYIERILTPSEKAA